MATIFNKPARLLLDIVFSLMAIATVLAAVVVVVTESMAHGRARDRAGRDARGR